MTAIVEKTASPLMVAIAFLTGLTLVVVGYMFFHIRSKAVLT